MFNVIVRDENYATLTSSTHATMHGARRSLSHLYRAAQWLTNNEVATRTANTFAVTRGTSVTVAHIVETI